MNLKTKTTGEAMELLERTRSKQIAIARRCADDLIYWQGTATTKQVVALMDAQGELDNSIPMHWLGAVFNQPKYKWTGRSDLGVGHAGRGAKVWTHV